MSALETPPQKTDDGRSVIDMSKMNEGQRAAFLDDYEHRIDVAYPARSDGLRLLSFPRLFIVATRRA